MSLPPEPTSSLRVLRAAGFGRSGFRSFKTLTAIPYPSRWHRDLLIQATLDTAIESIEPDTRKSQDPRAFGIFVRTRGVRILLMAIRDDIDGVEAEIPVSGIPISRSYVLAEPRCSAARAVWAARTTLVAPIDRIRILEALDEAAAGLPLAQLATSTGRVAPDPVSLILAIVCAGQADIDFSGSISPETVVRRRRVLPTGVERFTFQPLLSQTVL